MNLRSTTQKTTSSFTPIQTGLLQRKCNSCGQHMIAGGECTNCQPKSGLQRKLTIGASNDPLELEADQIADRVLAAPTNNTINPAPASIQRFTAQTADQADLAPVSVDRVLSSPGRPLETSLQDDMGQRFGHDFSHVRVHTGAEAARSAQDVNANAYTVGHNIVFGAGLFTPGTHNGRRLLAHELTHVVQQSSSDGICVEQGSTKRETSPITVQRDSTNREKLSQPRHSSTLPYREAKNLDDCIRIMGPRSAKYCRQEVLGEKVENVPETAEQVAIDLKSLIDDAVWKEIRKRVYPKESAAGIQRAKDRKAGTLPDLSGLGRIQTLEHFASAVRSIQARWTSFVSPDDRVKELSNAAKIELTNAEVPGFLKENKEEMKAKAFFLPSEWSFTINKELVNGTSLSDADAAGVANFTLHESRHAEQRFLAARFSAGVNNKDAPGIVAEQGIPGVIADEAVAKKFNSTTDPKIKDLGKQMHQATVTDRTKNQAISDDLDPVEFVNLEVKRAEAKDALKMLNASQTKQTIANAVTKRDALRAEISIVEQKYNLYRNIPYEVDAHEVGDAAEQAFKGWP
jgi:Domain of unknown function (DUF4157)